MNTEPLIFTILDPEASEKLNGRQYKINQLKISLAAETKALENEKIAAFGQIYSPTQKLEFAMDGCQGIVYLRDKV